MPRDRSSIGTDVDTKYDIWVFLAEFTRNNLSRVIVGKRLFGEGGAAAEYKEIAVELLEVAGAFVIGDYVRAVRWLDIGGVVARMKKAVKRHDEFMDEMIAEHRRSAASASGAGADDRKVDMISKMLELEDDAKLTDVDVKGILQDMFLGGTDTSSGTVERALSELVRHPEMMREAKEELDAVVGRGRLVEETDVAGLGYLRAVVKETLQLYPVAPMALPHSARESCVVDGCGVPDGTIAIVNIWAVGRDPKVWEDPLEFRPERFIPGRGGRHVDVTGKDFELIPFGAGRRGCVGMNLGLMMVHLMLASLVHAFDWGVSAGGSVGSPEELDM